MAAVRRAQRPDGHPEPDRVAPAVGAHRPRDAGLLQEELIKNVAIAAPLALLCGTSPASTHERLTSYAMRPQEHANLHLIHYGSPHLPIRLGIGRAGGCQPMDDLGDLRRD